MSAKIAGSGSGSTNPLAERGRAGPGRPAAGITECHKPPGAITPIPILADGPNQSRGRDCPGNCGLTKCGDKAGGRRTHERPPLGQSQWPVAKSMFQWPQQRQTETDTKAAIAQPRLGRPVWASYWSTAARGATAERATRSQCSTRCCLSRNDRPTDRSRTLKLPSNQLSNNCPRQRHSPGPLSVIHTSDTRAGPSWAGRLSYAKLRNNPRD
jgi:hypothetical protein